METGAVLVSCIFGNLTLNLQSVKRLDKVSKKLDLHVTPFSLFLDLVVWLTIRQSLCLTNIAVCSIVSESETRIALSIVLVVSPKTTHLH